MKAFIFLIAILLTTFTAPAQTTEKENVLTKYKESQTGIVSQQDGLAIVYQPSPEGTHIVLANSFDADKPIYYNLFSISNKPALLYVLKPEYEFRFSVFAASGESVELTPLGANYGKRFDDLKTVDPDAIAMNNRGTPMHDIAFLPDLSPGYGPSIPAPEKLFKFKNPGNYIVMIEAACYASRDFPPRLGALESNYFLVKFPPVKLTVLKQAKK